ncbi:signal peptide, CUB and EGF-like domain-containing protein 1 isoform X2 [Dreissena polymorpha]|uniref:signal peptide, CUB and EGF-like domain-containing protein 1 isoform X2 n=1 Tax=Dreissena polymorpha TaxID=45954 RepID=UPI0022650513|nr:signal peptide, CUB and EGF-like domain-containing protein 1 isoform X2 [Dreissena polymorpha]
MINITMRRNFIALQIGIVILCNQAARGRDENTVHIDLQRAIVKGYSPYIHFLQTPSLSNGSCASQAVVKVDFSGPYRGLELDLDYAKNPRLWTLDITDSPTGDGYGGDDGNTSNMAELQILNRQMRIYGNSLPGYMEAISDGGLLIRTIDDFASKGSKANIKISDERIDWSRGKIKDFLSSKYLFTLNGQTPQYGDVEYDVYFGFNRVVAGNYRNGSGLCSVTLRLLTYPGNQCEKGTLQCPMFAECIDSVRTSRCRCKRGFYGAGHVKCTDVDECATDNGGCVHFCENTQGNYTCSCRDGFQLDLDGKDCIDMNECFRDKGGCEHQCVNTLGGYECRCNQGYSLEHNGRSCKVGSYCQKYKGCEHSCTTNALDSVVCTCRPGYRLHSNGTNCIQTCSVGNGGCQHNCTDTPDTVQCTCAQQYILNRDNKTCTASCEVNNGGCERKCTDTPEGPVCSCPEGFELHQNQKNCLDVDECARDNGGCSHTCVNLEGDYECVCPSGYMVYSLEKTCKDIDECEVNGTCDHLCVNTAGSYLCTCNEGFDRYGVSHCADKDECSDNNGGCAHGCVNTQGSFRCKCNEGYKLFSNGRDCVVESKCYDLRAPPGGKLTCKTRGENVGCRYTCEQKGMFVERGFRENITTFCGPETNFTWDHERKNVTLPPCSTKIQSPNIGRLITMKFVSKRCKRREQVIQKLTEDLTTELNAQKKYKCSNKCRISGRPKITCQKQKQVKGQGRAGYKVTAEVNLSYMSLDKLKSGCDVKCEMKKTERKLRKVIKKLKTLGQKNEFKFSYAGDEQENVKIKSPRKQNETWSCDPNNLLLGDHCVGCSAGYFYDRPSRSCAPCRPGFYQDEEGRFACKPCPHNPGDSGLYAAKSVEECSVQCEPGHYSESGLKPCKPCPQGTYQPGLGRLSCQACEGHLTTRDSGATSFKQCLTKVSCAPGHFYKSSSSSCLPCPISHYQPRGGQNYCVKCPNGTTTDHGAATDVSHCKSHVCGGVFGKEVEQGLIQSPNYPGDYPTNVSCVWKIRPAKNRRILFIVPEVYLTKGDKCGDKLVMRKSKNEISTITYETCETSERPIAITARSKRLWVEFRSDGQNTARGFSIPFVTFNEDYQRLIESIVQDGRLYSSFQHQSVLKDRMLLTNMMRLIANPEGIFEENKYRKIMESRVPRSFIKLIQRKVIRFFNP